MLYMAFNQMDNIFLNTESHLKYVQNNIFETLHLKKFHSPNQLDLQT